MTDSWAIEYGESKPDRFEVSWKFTLLRPPLRNRAVTNLHLSFWLYLQQYLLMFSSTMVIPFILSGPLCFSDKPVVISNVLSTTIFVAGIVTFLQSTFGCRWVEAIVYFYMYRIQNLMKSGCLFERGLIWERA